MPAEEQARHPLVQAQESLLEAEALRLGNKLDGAEAICGKLLRQYPGYVGALRILGLVLIDRQDYAQALSPLLQAIMLNPGDWVVLTALGTAHLRLGNAVLAARTLEEAHRRKPDDVSVLLALANLYREDSEFESAAVACRKAVAADPASRLGWAGLAKALAHLGQDAAAMAAQQQIISLGKHTAHTLYAISQLPAMLLKTDLMPLIEKLGGGLPADDIKQRSFISCARSAALGRAGNFDESWRCLAEVNAQIWPLRQPAYERDRIYRENCLAQVRSSPDLIPGILPAADCPVSLFILGPSRSGKTTLERLAGTLAGVRRGYENPIVRNAVRQTFQAIGMPSAQRLADLPAVAHAACRDFYMEELKERAPGAAVFTNTHPGRIMDACRIGAILPNVRIIFVKRNIHDQALRIFGKLFTEAHDYSYNLAKTHEYLAWYDKMADAVVSRLPAITRVISYEDMIADPLSARRAIASLCGLPATDDAVPELGDDRGCSAPYRCLMDQAIR